MTVASGAVSAPEANKPRFQHLHRLLRAHGDRTPDATAIHASGARPTTYGELLAQTGRIEVTLRSSGVGRDDRVAVVLPNGPAAAVALVGVACAAVAAPLDPDARAAEFDHYLTGLDAKAVVVERGSETLAVAVARAQGRLVIEVTPTGTGRAGAFDLAAVPPYPDGRQDAAADSREPDRGTHRGTHRGTDREPDREPDRGPDPRDVAYVLHTSGTTGRPKLVPLTHETVCTSAHNIGVSLRLSERDRCLNVLPLIHGHGLMSPLLATLWAGASVVCTPGFDATAFPGWLDEFCPTWYTAVPTVHQAVLAALAPHPGAADRAPLRFVRSASAPLAADLREALERTLGVPLIDSYGMTEACSIITSSPLPPAPRKPGSVGVSVGNELAVMDEPGRLLGVGETGEIVLRGATVIDGYAHDPAATERAFTGGWFRTGDLGHLDEDGFLFVTGRLKEIINRGGTKISPVEIDEVLMAHPAVAEAAAFPLPHATLGEEVAAAVVMRERPEADDEELRGFLAARLAEAKIPRRIFRVAAIPRTSTGKVQRAGLAGQVVPAAQPRQAVPGTPMETRIAEIWGELLGVAPDRVGSADHFFDLGGNSLLMKRAQIRLAEVTGRNVPVVQLFAHPTVTALAGYLTRTEQGRDQQPGGLEQENRRLSDGGKRLARQRDQRRRQRDVKE